MIRELTSNYKKRKREIKKRLDEFASLQSRSDKEVFSELCFCILTPQSKAILCDAAIKELKSSGLLFKGSESDLRSTLRGRARFHNKKANYLVRARKIFQDKKGFDVKKKLKEKNIPEVRNWLVNNVKGLGYKEASHFLRNIGFGKNISILDVHILRNLRKLGVIEKIPTSLTKKSYLDIEAKMRKFSKRISIPVEELDLLFWSNQTGYIFK